MSNIITETSLEEFKNYVDNLQDIEHHHTINSHIGVCTKIEVTKTRYDRLLRLRELFLTLRPSVREEQVEKNTYLVLESIRERRKVYKD